MQSPGPIQEEVEAGERRLAARHDMQAAPRKAEVSQLVSRLEQLLCVIFLEMLDQKTVQLQPQNYKVPIFKTFKNHNSFIKF